MKNLDEKLNSVYNFTKKFTEENGFSPSVRDICHSLNIKSTASCYSYLKKLQNLGLLNKSPYKNRAISITKSPKVTSIPILGSVRAGQPIFAEENIEGYLPLPKDFSGENEFALKVQGDSMKNAGIYENDVIIVKKTSFAKNGDIVVALLEDSATVKRLFINNNQIILHPENENYQDILCENVIILGVVKGLMRKF